MGNIVAKVFKACYLLDLLHKRFSGLGSVYGAEHSLFGMHSCPKTPTMARHSPEMPYVDPDIDL